MQIVKNTTILYEPVYWLCTHRYVYIQKERISHQQYPLLCYVIRMGLEPMTPTLKVLCSTS